MKKLIKLMAAFMFLFTFTFVSPFQEVDAAKYPGTSVTAKPGDILVTKKSSCKTNCRGITGHAGIVVNNDYVVHIAGIGHHPTKIKLATWFSKYTSTTVVRTTDKYRGDVKGAVKWAEDYIKKYPNAEYKITPNLVSKDPTYCSKLVYQAYKYGGGLEFICCFMVCDTL